MLVCTCVLVLGWSQVAATEETETMPMGITGESSAFSSTEEGAAGSGIGGATGEPIPQTASQEERLQKIVNLSFTNANLSSVLSSLAKVYGLNIVTDDPVSGAVTLTLRAVTLGEGLKQLLRPASQRFLPSIYRPIKNGGLKLSLMTVPRLGEQIGMLMNS
jgi:hypothetical protein